METNVSMEKGKRNKITTNKQFDILLEELKKCPDLGNPNPTFLSKRQWEEKWEVIRAKLNSCGPPMRSTAEWKRVWVDIKARTKRKFSENIEENGDPVYATIYLNKHEREVADIIGISVDPTEHYKTPKRVKTDDSDDTEVLTEFQFVSAPRSESPENVKFNSAAISRASTFPSTTGSTSAAAPVNSATISAVSEAIFNAVTAAASAAISNLTSSSEPVPNTASTSTPIAKPVKLIQPEKSTPLVSSSKRHKNNDKDNNAKCLKLLRRQVASQTVASKALDRIADVIDLYISDLSQRQTLDSAAVTDLPDSI